MSVLGFAKCEMNYFQVRHNDAPDIVQRVTNSSPYLVADGLYPGTDYVLYVSYTGPLGNSTPVTLQAFRVNTAEKRMGNYEQNSTSAMQGTHCAFLHSALVSLHTSKMDL